MQFNILYLSLTLLSILSALVCVHGNSQQWLDVCKKACDQDFLPKIEFLAVNYNRGQTELDEILPDMEECQYRCYRCYLPGVISAMNDIKKVFAKNEHEGWIGRAKIENGRRSMIFYLNSTCYSPWENAIRNNDETSTF